MPSYTGGADWLSLGIGLGSKLLWWIGEEEEQATERGREIKGLSHQWRLAKALRGKAKEKSALEESIFKRGIGEQKALVPEMMSARGFSPGQAPGLEAEPYRKLETAVRDYMAEKKIREEAEALEWAEKERRVGVAKEEYLEDLPMWRDWFGGARTSREWVEGLFG